MVIAPLSLREDYWDSFVLQEEDLDYLYNRLLELETPLTSKELTAAVVERRIQREKQSLEQHLPAEGKLYIPKDHYQVGDILTFPALGWKKGKVVAVRPGKNPEQPPFEVFDVEFEQGNQRQFAAGVENHRLNLPIEIRTDDPQLDPAQVIHRYGEKLSRQLEEALKENPDLVRIAARWFPRALLVDVNIGHLNLAEAVLDMTAGGPLTTHALIEQIDLPTDVNSKLTEFSLNLALQEDPRFDEVGPAGEVLWFLQRLEPEAIQKQQIYLHYNPSPIDRTLLSPEMITLEGDLDDDHSDLDLPSSNSSDLTVSLIFPHWRTGTLPLTRRMERLFPTAYESPRIQFTLVDGDTGERFQGWVVRPQHIVYGLSSWYAAQGLIPGSLVHVKRGKNPGEVIVKVEKRRSSREWIRTVLVGADGGIVYAMLKQVMTATFDERMAIAVPDVSAIDSVWEQSARQRGS
ncbi:MAG: hypothetical protein PHQ40_13025, partial [Anaerolineaceae bacterium]|nr:hypothetical protein [Anaerolineaceae bacterium]